jgi:hypothetical protein
MRLFIFLLAAIIAFGSVSSVEAASLFLVPEASQAKVGDNFHIDVRLDTNDQSINAVQTKINFPANILKLNNTDKTDSVFNFWLQEPAISQEIGVLQFISGTTKGISGSTLEVLRLNFTVLEAGEAALSFSESAVTANDGRGTDVLSEIRGVTIKTELASSVAGSEAITPIEHTIPPAQPAQEQPVPIEREAVPSGVRPKAPEVRVPLYPDQEGWYNQLGEVTVFWNLPDDITRIATALDRNPNTSPENIEGGLSTGKKFGALDEGIWYVHVQFRNNIGWGPETHYRIALDLTPPLPFEVSIDPEVSDNPTPGVTFETQDAMSGVSHSQIFIDGQAPLSFPNNDVKLPPQSPGKYTMVVKVFDLAGNSVEDIQEFEILPLPTPTINFISGSVATEEQLFVSGKSIVSAFVDIRVYNSKQKEVYRASVLSEDVGNWSAAINGNLAAGGYSLTATARDGRGAMSFPTEPRAFRIRPATVISLGFVDLGWIEVLIIVILLIVIVASFFLQSYVSAGKTRQAYRIILGRDIEKLTDLLIADLGKLRDWSLEQRKKFTAAEMVDYEHFLDKVADTAAKIKKYIPRSVNKLK